MPDSKAKPKSKPKTKAKHPLARFAPPTLIPMPEEAPVFGPPLIPPSYGAPQDEQASADRTFPLDAIPDFDLLKQVVPNWMLSDPSVVGQGPTTGYAYGGPEQTFNIPGEYNKRTDKIGLQASTATGAMQGNPKDLEVLGHETTHSFQKRPRTERSAYGTKENFRDLLRNIFETSDTAYTPESSPTELEALIMGRLVRNLTEVQQQEDLQKKHAPELRPR